MSMTDPVADLLTRIRNGQRAGKTHVSLDSSKIKTAIVRVLKDEGYVADFHIDGDVAKPRLTIDLKYFEGRPVIDRLERVSRPGLRIYRGQTELPKVLGGMGTVAGPIAGTFLFMGVEEVLKHFTDHWVALFGLLVVAMAMLGKAGVVGWWQQQRLNAAHKNSAKATGGVA
jgi:small subunit ribosomal protein S8